MTPRLLLTLLLAGLPAAAQQTERAYENREILYELLATETHAFRITHDYTETRPGTAAYLNVVRGGSQVREPESLDLDTGRKLRWEILTGAEVKRRGLGTAELRDDSQVVVTHYERPVAAGGSVRVRLMETYEDAASYYERDGELIFDRTLGRPRNLVALPAGWRLTASLSPATVATLADGRVLLSFENPRHDELHVVIRARRRDEPLPLVYGAGLPRRTWNPLAAGGGWSEAVNFLLSRLFRTRLSGELEPDLAESFERSPDARTYTVRLRANVRWHDGRPFTSADVEFTFSRALNQATRDNLAMLDRLEAPDPRTVVFRLKSPDAMFPAALLEVPIFPQHAYETFERKPVGTGPYRPADERGAAFVAHAEFHFGAPKLPRLVLREIAGDDERAEALLNGEVDIAQVKPQHLERLKANPEIRIYRMTNGIWRALPLNLRRPALKDRRVRQAISLAIDRDELVAKALGGYGQAAYSPLPPRNWAYFPVPGRYDPERARKLLAEAGYKPGQLQLRLIVWKDELFRRTAAELIRAQLLRVGIGVEMELVDNVAYNRLAEDMGDRYDGYIGGWSALHDPGDNLYKKFHSRGSQNRSGFSSPALDRLLEQARRETNREAARRLYRRIVRTLVEEQVRVPLAYPDYLFAARRDLRGLADATLDEWYSLPRFGYLWWSSDEN